MEQRAAVESDYLEVVAPWRRGRVWRESGGGKGLVGLQGHQEGCMHVRRAEVREQCANRVLGTMCAGLRCGNSAQGRSAKEKHWEALANTQLRCKGCLCVFHVCFPQCFQSVFAEQSTPLPDAGSCMGLRHTSKAKASCFHPKPQPLSSIHHTHAHTRTHTHARMHAYTCFHLRACTLAPSYTQACPPAARVPPTFCCMMRRSATGLPSPRRMGSPPPPNCRAAEGGTATALAPRPSSPCAAAASCFCRICSSKGVQSQTRGRRVGGSGPGRLRPYKCAQPRSPGQSDRRKTSHGALTGGFTPSDVWAVWHCPLRTPALRSRADMRVYASAARKPAPMQHADQGTNSCACSHTLAA